MKTIKVEIGTTVREFGLFHTRAPKAYDHGGVLEVRAIAGDEKGRLILVPLAAVEWSRGRYGSGMYSFVEAEEWLVDLVDGWLWERLYGEES